MTREKERLTREKEQVQTRTAEDRGVTAKVQQSDSSTVSHSDRHHTRVTVVIFSSPAVSHAVSLRGGRSSPTGW